MKLRDILKDEKITVSMEVFPPKTTANYESVEKAALGVAALKPAYMSVTYGAGGSTRGNTVNIAYEIQDRYDVTTIAHLTCVGAGREDIKDTLGRMKEAGIENILALRGDRPKDFEGDPFKEILRNTAISASEGHVTQKDIRIRQRRKRTSLILRKKLTQAVNFSRHRCFLTIIFFIISYIKYARPEYSCRLFRELCRLQEPTRLRTQ